MAAQLIADMTGPWQATDYADQFSAAILARVKKKVEAGETAAVTTLENAPEQVGANNVVDLTELLAQSLAKRKPGGGGGDGSAVVAAKKASARSSVRRRG
jgi:DNA end-binding protein Ku